MPPTKQQSLTRKSEKAVEKSENEQKLEQLFQHLNIRRIYPGSQRKDDPEKPKLDRISCLMAAAGKMSTSENPKPKEEHFCKVCHKEFPTKMTWWWHDLRHVGHHKFKCTICTKVLESPTACWMHERNAHGYSAKPFLYDPRKDPEHFPELQPEAQTSAAAKKKDKPSLSEKVATSTSVLDAQRMSLEIQKHLPWLSVEPQPGTSKELLGTNPKSKSDELSSDLPSYLSWLYVCERCGNCAEVFEAKRHYNLCFPNKEKDFEETTFKYRKGYYGHRKCPLCPLLRYPTNMDWIKHCKDKHQRYVELLKQDGEKDDPLMCNKCEIKFGEPVAFHQHLKTVGKENFQCGGKPKDEAKKTSGDRYSLLEARKVSVGGSPIDRMQIDDLLSIQTIRRQLQCLICRKKAKELGVIADCLRDHGIQICSLCFNTYCSKKDLEMHLKECHGKGLNRKLKCPLCPKVFRNYIQICGHMYCEHWQQILKQIEEEDKEEEEDMNKVVNYIVEDDEDEGEEVYQEVEEEKKIEEEEGMNKVVEDKEEEVEQEEDETVAHATCDADLETEDETSSEQTECTDSWETVDDDDDDEEDWEWEEVELEEGSLFSEEEEEVRK